MQILRPGRKAGVSADTRILEVFEGRSKCDVKTKGSTEANYRDSRNYWSATATVNGVVDRDEGKLRMVAKPRRGSRRCCHFQFWAKKIDVNRTITVSGGQCAFSKSGYT